MANHPVQIPAPGSHILAYQGNVLTFELRQTAGPGSAWLRTNIGRAKTKFAEIVRQVENGEPLLACDWHDISMTDAGDGNFTLQLPLPETGCFQAKAFFLPKDNRDYPDWPPGDNVQIKVEPAATVCANSIYSAFVRQFGPDAGAARSASVHADIVAELDEANWAVIPRSGTFRDLIRHLDTIINTMRFRIIQLLPIHPTPTVYGRMGRFGSPFATLDFLDVDPALAEFDRRTTPLEQFQELLDAVHARHARVFLDMPINHTGWASQLQVTHPEWFVRNHDRTFHSPGAWGVTWEDLAKLDYGCRDLWRYMAEVFLYWCRRGVDGFRCDAGYMVPVPVWKYIVAKVRQQFPDTVFFLEGLGGKLRVTEALLEDAGLDWAYSELFQNYSRQEIEGCLGYTLPVAGQRGNMIHFAETHDNNRLAASSQEYAAMRTALAALCATAGGFGITNGVEWFATEKVDVHQAGALNWGAAENQTAAIARLNTIISSHPAFFADAEVQVCNSNSGTALAVYRTSADKRHPVMILANLNTAAAETLSPEFPEPWATSDAVDLLTGNAITLKNRDAERFEPRLEPGQVLCLTPEPAWFEALETELAAPVAEPEQSRQQRLKTKALEIITCLDPDSDCDLERLDIYADMLAEAPGTFIRSLYPNQLPPVLEWEWPGDSHRTVMLPRNFLLLVRASDYFKVELSRGNFVFHHENALPLADGSGYFCVIPPVENHSEGCKLQLRMIIFNTTGVEKRNDAPLLLLPAAAVINWQAAPVFSGHQAANPESYAVCANPHGALAQFRAAWGGLHSRYDALLAANLAEDYPEDRRVMFTRCRAWLVQRGYSQAVNPECLERFELDGEHGAVWHFLVPAGMGKLVRLRFRLNLHPVRNSVRLEFFRDKAGGEPECLADNIPVQLILRPDIEDRSAHETTKAFTGPEQFWPAALQNRPDGFRFAPRQGYSLDMYAHPGTYTPEPEWQYMIRHPFEAERGMDDSSDLFSPGYFRIELAGNSNACLQADVLTEYAPAPATDFPADQAGLEPLRRAMRQFLVYRENKLSVIAGFPWFLDWGRDTLIFLRGLVAAGYHDEAALIIQEFASLERAGTLPNMLNGADDANRDTSDAPLWLLVACRDLWRTETQPLLFETDCNGRTLREVLLSLARGYMQGTGNGIAMDQDSGLIYSPSHFTWMDTNYPAGTPRSGYPIEIQALWFAALKLLANIDPEHDWQALATQVQESVCSLYKSAKVPWLCDCLSAESRVPAAQAVQDTKLRSNQLLALTLGCVTDKDLGRTVLDACSKLLVPGAIRSLADLPVLEPHPVYDNGQLLNDPRNPYWGTYAGAEDTRRKPAYHNGTAWTWPFPSWCEALYLIYGESAREPALEILSSGLRLFHGGCLGHSPEIVDGDTPHRQRGCGAQAWGVSELYRVLAFLQS